MEIIFLFGEFKDSMPYVKAVNKVLVVGTVSNIARNLDRDIHRVLKALSSLDVVGIYLVESDSVDETISILSHLSQEIPFFNFVSLGTLRGIIPERISRIRYCRNIYVNYIRAFKANHEIDFVVIADLDGMNTAISRRGIDSTFIREGWGAVLANQTGGYYDLLALRHPNWCPGDVMEELKNLQEVIVERGVTKASLISKFRRRMDFDKARKISIYSKMKIFPRNSQWIEVESGFGGFGIYRAEIFSKFDF